MRDAERALHEQFVASGKAVAQDVLHPHLRPRQQVKEPDAHPHIQAEEVGQADDCEADEQVQRKGIAEKRQVMAEFQLGKERKVVIDPHGAQGQKRDGEARPRQRVFEKRVDDLPGLTLLGHIHRQLDQREGQPIVVDPLSAHQHHGRDHHQVDGDDERAPGRQRHQPGFPGDAVSLWKPFKEKLDGVRILGHQPVAHERLQQFRPAVFRGGVVENGRQHGDQIGGESPRRDRRGHEHHHVDDDQLGPTQSPGSLEQLEQRIDDANQDEEQENRTGRDVVGRHTGRVHGQQRVRKGDADDQGEESPE